MTGFFWKMRGFNKTTKHSVVRDWIRSQPLHFGGLIETRVKEGKAGSIVNYVFHNWSFMANYEHNQLGRIWVVWDQSVKMTPVYKSSQLITCSVLLEGRTEESKLTTCQDKLLAGVSFPFLRKSILTPGPNFKTRLRHDELGHDCGVSCFAFTERA